MLIPEDGDSSSEEDQETVDFRNEQYTRDDIDSEAPQQAPEETPEEIPEKVVPLLMIALTFLLLKRKLLF